MMGLNLISGEIGWGKSRIGNDLVEGESVIGRVVRYKAKGRMGMLENHM